MKSFAHALILFPAIASGILVSQLSYAGNPIVRHELKVQLDPSTHRLEVEDSITLPQAESSLRFTLHDGLNPSVRIPNAPSSAGTQAVITDSGKLDSDNSLARIYLLTLPEGVTNFVVRYAGEINHPLSAPEEEYDRGFGTTPGLIGEEGIYLANTSAWLPRFEDELVTFSVEATLPAGWDAVSQGDRTGHIKTAQSTQVRWESRDAQDEVYLIGGKFTEYEQRFAGVQAYAFLQTPDPELAAQYLQATDKYVTMYNELIGQYPYGKFALVENFWETGFGMPSFTLLGPKIIRFPFIIDSSYPHEILHNWWGNGVYVDYSTGNWCEGITAYLADHLMKEQQGGGADYRRTTLQKYTDYATPENDFPLTQFMDRYNGITEAVGYGKSLMFFHMLRRELGDELFTRGIQKFYLDHKFQRVRFDDIRLTLESLSGRDLSREFKQWVTQTGAPELRVSNATAREQAGQGFEVSFTLDQIQPGSEYQLHVPVAISMQGAASAFQTEVVMNSRTAEFKLLVPSRPYQIDIDPEYDLFRRLNRYEIPPSLSQGFGSNKILLVLPSAAPAATLEAYRQLSKDWSVSQESEYETKLDSEIQNLPSDRAVWLLGWENKFVGALTGAMNEYGVSVTDSAIQIAGSTMPRDNHSLVLSVRNPGNPAQVIAWAAATPVAAVPGLDRKLPHYGKYGYLVFEGDEPKNVAKGIWPTLHSPMSIAVTQADGTVVSGPRGKLKPRSALVEMPAAFSAANLKKTVDVLTQPSAKGRELGTPELDQVADFISGEFQKMGILPGGDQGYFQSWSEDLKAPKGMTQLKNVIGIIPGKNPALKGQSLVVGAHYDHLGLGWPDVHAGDQGKIHPGADDNASGVAVLLELARFYQQRAADGALPERTLVFVAFTGEEAGLLGSKHYLQVGITGYPSKQIFAMLNLDTVGRLGANKITVIGTDSAKEWPQVVAGVGYVIGAQFEQVASSQGSDQFSFTQAGIPALQFFSGANADYHRPTDTADKLDYAGMVKIASGVKECVDYLAARAEPLTSGGAVTPPDPSNPGRKVFFGTIPDFAYQGPGLRITGVMPDSPAEKAGLAEGDVIVELNGVQISDLRGYSNFLKTLHAGDVVQVRYLRNGVEKTTSATVIER